MIAVTLLKLQHPQHLEVDLDSFSESATNRTEKLIKSKNCMIYRVSSPDRHTIKIGEILFIIKGVITIFVFFTKSGESKRAEEQSHPSCCDGQHDVKVS
jgi:hypothetical protein